MDNLRRLLDIRRMDRVLNTRIRELRGVKKGLDERIDEGVLRWRGWKGIGLPRVFVGECTASRSVGRPRKRWNNTVKECLKKRGFVIRQARRIVQERSEWRGFVRGNSWGVARGMNPRS